MHIAYVSKHACVLYIPPSRYIAAASGRSVLQWHHRPQTQVLVLGLRSASAALPGSDPGSGWPLGGHQGPAPAECIGYRMHIHAHKHMPGSGYMHIPDSRFRFVKLFWNSGIKHFRRRRQDRLRSSVDGHTISIHKCIIYIVCGIYVV